MVSAGQAKIASVPTAPRATDGLGNALSGYSAAITAATGGDTPRDEQIMPSQLASVTRGPLTSPLGTNMRHSSALRTLLVRNRVKMTLANACFSHCGTTS